MEPNRFPADRAANRQYLLDAVDSIAEVVMVNRDRSEADRTLAPASVEAIRESGLFLLTMHPHIIGHRSRMKILEGLIEHMRTVDGVWFATHAEVARYCLEAADSCAE